MTKYVFLTGGVISSLGKGITSASLGALFKSRNLKTTIIKIDGYLNVDAGLMSPYEHGEVFVTKDGVETDLDIGHYERFLGTDLNQFNNITSGKIYLKVLNKERNGEYLGKTVQVIPHVTNEIKEWIEQVSKEYDISIIEIGGVVGDIESMAFIEAARQMSLFKKGDCIFVHLALIPYLNHLHENKTKPLQNSIKTLQSLGIQPQIVICRTSKPLSDQEKQKIALLTNVPPDDIFCSVNVSDKHLVPYILYKQKLDDSILQKLNFLKDHDQAKVTRWEQLYNKIQGEQSKTKVNLGFIQKYTKGSDNYISLAEALQHSAWDLDIDLNVIYINSENYDIKELQECDCILIPGGYGNRGLEGKIKAAQYARENDIPFLGICLGFQTALIEFGRNVLNLEDCNSREFNDECKNPIIEEIDVVLQVKNHETKSDLIIPKKQRIGERKIILTKNSQIYDIYNQQEEINERFRHRYSFNMNYKQQVEENGISFVGSNFEKDIQTHEIFEYKKNKFYIAVQFHPEFNSRVFNPHPLFNKFLNASIKKKQQLNFKYINYIIF